MKTKSVRYSRAAFIVFILLALFISGCGGKTTVPAAPLTEVSVRLKWTHQVQFAGIYTADKDGYYGEENLKITIDPVDFGQMDTVKDVVDGKHIFGVASADEIIGARSRGVPVKAIAVIFRISPLLLMSIDDVKINKPEDLLGKTVAVHAGQASTVFSAFVSKTGLDTSQFTRVDASSFDILECLQTADVCTGYSTDAVISAQMKGHETSSILFGDYGVPFYADIIFTTDDYMAQNPDVVERFLRATIRGWKTAIENPEKSVATALTFDPKLDKEFQTLSMKATIPLVDTGVQPIGVMEPDMWQQMYDILLEQKAISAFDVTTAYTSEFMDKISK
jgi:NitT/TauT family transport system substrate-binding protein